MARRKKKNRPKRGTDRPSKDGAEAVAIDRARPWLLAATVALFVARPLFPSEGTAEVGDGLPAVMLWLALAVFWMLDAIGRRQFRVRFGPVDAAVGLLVGWYALSAVWAAMHVSPRPAINMLWQWIGLGTAYFLARQFLVTRRETRAAIAVMIALAVGVSAYGLYQVAYEMPQTRAEYAADPDGMLRASGMWFPPDSPGRRNFEARLASTEPLATFALTNSLAGLLAPWLVVLAGIGIGGFASDRSRHAPRDGLPHATYRSRHAPRDGLPHATYRSRHAPRDGLPHAEREVYDESRRVIPAPPLRRWLPVTVCGLVIGTCLVLTKSRTAYLATAVGMATLALLAYRQRLRIGWKIPSAVALLLALVVGGAVATGGLDLPVLSEAPKSVVYRVEYWQSTAAIIADHPILGCGPGNFQGTYTAYKLPQASEEVADPHNFLLEIWASAGTPAMLALVAVLVLYFRRTRGNGNGIENEHGVGSHLSEQDTETRPDPISTDRDAAWFVYGGAAAGFVISVPLGQMTTAPPPLAAVGVALPAAALAAWLLTAWVREGRLPPWLPAVGLGVLLVHLLASGGISYPGVAGTFWLLLAIGLGARPLRTASWNVAAAGLFVAAVLAVACYATAYSPVVQAQGKLSAARTALNEGRVDRAKQLLEESAAADRWAAEPHRQLASIALARWKQTGEEAVLKDFDNHVDEALRLAPLSSSVWQAAGDWYLEVFAETQNPHHIDQAVVKHRRAVDLYPNSPLARARLSIALDTAGKPDEARHEAEEALRLDEITPHADKKLPDKLRRSLVNLIGE